jgi:hypothetical protein
VSWHKDVSALSILVEGVQCMPSRMQKIFEIKLSEFQMMYLCPNDHILFQNILADMFLKLCSVKLWKGLDMKIQNARFS